MATKYLLNTPNADNTLPGSQIQSGTITSTQVDGTIALQSSLDAAIKGLTPKGSVAGVIFATEFDGPVIWNTTNGGRIQLSVYAPISDIAPVLGYDGSTLALNSKVLFSFSSADREKSGIYNVAVLGAAGSPSVGSFTVNAGASVVDGNYFTIDDGLGNTVNFEFDSNSSVTPGNVAVPFTAGDSASTIGAAIVVAIESSDLFLAPGSAVNASGTVTITTAFAGTAGNTTITQSGSSLSSITSFTGGTNGTYGYFERADNFNEAADISFGAYVVVNAGTYANQIWYLKTEGAITLNTTNLIFAHWGETGAVYSAGNGISISGGNEISVKHDTSLTFVGGSSDTLSVLRASGGVITESGSGINVQAASSSQSGVISAAEWKVLSASGETGAHFGIANTAVTRTTDLTAKTFSSPYGTLGENKSALVEVTVVSRSVNVDGSADVTGTCIQKWAFTLARDASDTVVLDSVQLFKSGTSNILGCTVAMQVTGLEGADAIAVTGVDGVGGSTTIDHNVSIVCRTL